MKKRIISLPYNRELPALFVRNDGEEAVVVILGLEEKQPIGLFYWNGEGALSVPDYVTECTVTKRWSEQGNTRFDFSFFDEKGYRVHIEGLNRAFNNEYANYARLTGALLLAGVELRDVIREIEGLSVDEKWRSTVIRALREGREWILQRTEGPQLPLFSNEE